MVANKGIEDVFKTFGHKHCTRTKELISALNSFSLKTTSSKLSRLKNDIPLPAKAILKIKWHNKGSHWVVLNCGMIYDPASGTCDIENYKSSINGKITSYLEIAP